MMRSKLLLPVLFSLLSLACLAYLVWWDRLGVYTGYHNRYELATDRWAVAAFLLSALIGLVSIVLSFKYRGYLFPFLPLLLLTGYFLRIHHGIKITTLKGCDMSICNTLDMYTDGTYFFRSSSQQENTTHSGEFSFSGDTLVLSPDANFPSPSKADLARIKEDRCLLLRPVGFQASYLDISCVYD